MADANSRSVLIADDEPLARERIRRLVEALPAYEVCGEAADGEEVLTKIAQQGPDILLLDIRMPGMDGMEAAERIAALEAPPAIIFCTAYDHYAIQAFDVHAVAYLLKPVRREALAEALKRAGRVNRVQLQALAGQDIGTPEQLAIRTHRGTELIDIRGILYCEADQKYVTIHHVRGETVTDYTLKELENAYPQHLLRIHRHTLVGVRFIQALLRNGDGQNAIDLTDNHGRLPVSRRHTASVRQWLKQQRPG
ncbi:LytR/AlgR family response regulator transcription factor [Marinobacter orientalis]|uniref:Response regulator transcription factor n=1 Tax=Marinobacter orientalis TaxID=1928859 RepID=A0A7Y0RBL0_9GAMM|nr:LytTR family DNA-binding domain-containing protein [Marinobacter orientalis]NMT63246.1 response regulator transcription factor [Marinobacter orientalis]TGX51898.1 response regulator transcription factor [Marinobacter orientalis]